MNSCLERHFSRSWRHAKWLSLLGFCLNWIPVEVASAAPIPDNLFDVGQQNDGSMNINLNTLEENVPLPPAEPPEPPLGESIPLSLREALIITLRQNQNILMAQEQVLMAAGQRQEAAGPFDPRIMASVQGTRSTDDSRRTEDYTFLSRLLGLDITGSSSVDDAQSDLSARVNVDTMLRSGITFGPFVDYSGEFETVTGETIGDGGITVGGKVIVPLLAGLGPNNEFAADERAMMVEVSAARSELQFAVSQALYNTISAYWSCVLAQTNVRIARSQEAAARKLIGITEALIKGYVQPAIQLAQARANLEQYTSQRVSMELQQSMAAQQLGVAMGFTPEQLVVEILATDPFPAPPDNRRLRVSDIKQLIDVAMLRRADIRAQNQMVVANRILLAGARNAALPTLDLTVAGGFEQNNVTERTSSTSDRQTSQGLAVAAGIQFQYPIFNDAAEGVVTQQLSELEQAKTQASLTESQVTSNVIVAAKSVILSRESLDEALAAAKNEEVSVGAQEELFAMGMSSLVEVITTQTNLATAQMSVASNQSQYATALAQLRFATGTLTFNTAERVSGINERPPGQPVTPPGRP